MDISCGSVPQNVFSCPFWKPVLSSVGVLAFVLAAIPEPAHAGWVVEGERAVLVEYGGRYESELGTQAVHHGVDCLAGAGSQCLFPVEGMVVFVGAVPAGDVPGCGTTLAVSVRIADGRTVTLMPFEDVAVREGQRVAEGQIAGTVASVGDGSATSPHVHVGLKRGRQYYDPGEILGIAPRSTPEESETESGAASVVSETGTASFASAVTTASGQGEVARGLQVGRGYGVEAVAAGELAAAGDDLGEMGASAPSIAAGSPVCSAAEGANVSPYESWLAACDDFAGEADEPGASLPRFVEDARGLAGSMGMTSGAVAAVAISILMASCLAACVLAGKSRGEEGRAGRRKQERCAGKRGFREGAMRRLSMFGGLSSAHSGK